MVRMNRRHFLGLLPAIPVAVKAVGIVEDDSLDSRSYALFTGPVWAGIDLARPGSDLTVISFYRFAWSIEPIMLAVPSKKKNRGYIRKMRRAIQLSN